MFAHMNAYKELMRLASKVIKNPAAYKEILFEENGELKSLIKIPINLIALEAILEVLDEKARVEIVAQIASGFFNKFLSNDFLLKKFIECFPVLARIVKVKVYLNKNEYVITAGDTLSSVAKKAYGDSSYANLIAFANDLDNADIESILCIGLVLTLPHLHTLNNNHQPRSSIENQYNEFGQIIAQIGYDEQHYYTYNATGHVVREVMTYRKAIPQEVPLKTWLRMPNFMRQLVENNEGVICCDVWVYENKSNTIKKQIKLENYQTITSLSAFFQILERHSSILGFIPILYLVVEPNDKTKLALLLVDNYIKKNPSFFSEKISLYGYISEVCDFYLFPMQELSIDNVKDLIHALQKSNNKHKDLLIAYLLQQAANVYSLTSECNVKTLKIMLLDAMRYASTGLSSASELCQQFSKTLLWDIVAAYSNEFEKVRFYYHKIEFMRGEKIVDTLCPTSKAFQKTVESYFRFFIASPLPLNLIKFAVEKKEEQSSQALVVYNSNALKHL